MTPKISVIVAVYNAEQYLQQNMESILGQSLRDIEVICVDDGSTDHSLEMLESYAGSDSRVKVITQENQTAGAARNRGLEAAKGEYLSILDADDFFEREMLEKSYHKAKQTDADIVVYRCDRFDERKQFTETSWTIQQQMLPAAEVFSHKDMQDIYNCFRGWAWDKLFRREFIVENKLKFQKQKSINDLFFVYAALSKAERITVLDEVLAHKRHNNVGSITTGYKKAANWQNYHNALTALKVWLMEQGIYGELQRDFVNHALHFTLWNLMKLAGIPDFDRLYGQLKTGWLRELDILDKDEAFFYNKADHLRLCRLLELNAAQYSFYQGLAAGNGDFLFPFELVEKGSRIILYGAGRVGCSYYRQILYSGYCRLVAWVDKDHQEKGMGIRSPEVLLEETYDHVIIALNGQRGAKRLSADLERKGIPGGKIIWKSPEIDITEIMEQWCD